MPSPPPQDFDATSDAVPEHAPRSTPASSTRLDAGVTLANRYRIVAPLGKGGMGEVYRADDPDLNAWYASTGLAYPAIALALAIFAALTATRPSPRTA